MRKSLEKLISNCIALTYKLPKGDPAIPKIKVSTCSDECYQILSSDRELAEIIYNGIVDYSFNEADIDVVSSVNYYVNIGETVDNAARNAAKFVFNTLKYQTVKYLGLFNACYKYVIAQECNKNIDEISGFDSLLVRMEYNADTPYGRKANDIGVPFNVIDYYDKLYSNKDTDSFDRLDAYEKNKAKSIRSLIIQG